MMLRRPDFAGEPGTSTSCPPGSVSAGWKRTAARQQRAILRLYLHGMEQALGLRHRKNGWSVTANRCAVVRYADDFVILCNTEQEAQKAQETIAIWLAERGLQLSTEKTRIVHLKSGFDFLGFNVRMVATRKKRKGWALHITPSKRSVLKIKKRLHDEMKALQGHNVAAVIGKLNPIIRGWANYFKTQMSSATFRHLEHYMFQLERRYVDRMHPNKPIYFKQAKYFGKLNPFRNDYSVFGDKATGKYLEKFSWIRIVRHSLVKAAYSPDDPALNWYWDKRTLRKARDLRPILRTLALRQTGKCPLCGDSLFNEENIEKHHILRRNEGGGNNLDNLVLLHLYCHQQITAAQLKAIQSWRPKKIETIV
jgi:RNA-directed DNA polymerase